MDWQLDELEECPCVHKLGDDGRYYLVHRAACPVVQEMLQAERAWEPWMGDRFEKLYGWERTN